MTRLPVHPFYSWKEAKLPMCSVQITLREEQKSMASTYCKINDMLFKMVNATRIHWHDHIFVCVYGKHKHNIKFTILNIIKCMIQVFIHSLCCATITTV